MSLSLLTHDLNQRDAQHRVDVFFEPWGLGDAAIATAIARATARFCIVACRSAWHPILSAAIDNYPRIRFIGTDLSYGVRRNPDLIPPPTRIMNLQLPTGSLPLRVLSIRGDIRDYYMARRCFGAAEIHMRGWIAYLARRSRLLDFPYRAGLLAVRNRYAFWAELAEIPFSQVENSYQDSSKAACSPRKFLIHLGGQWRSKQYPHVARLRKWLVDHGAEITLVAANDDCLPKGVSESDVIRSHGGELIDRFRDTDVVVANDTGPMHIAALVGRPTVCIVHSSNFIEWKPPGVHFFSSSAMPRGYHPLTSFHSDSVSDKWPQPEFIGASIMKIFGRTYS